MAAKIAVIILAFTATIHAATTNRKDAAYPNPINAQIGKGQNNRAVFNVAFANAGQKPGVEVWRIQNFEPVPVNGGDYGKFHTGDAYIVLSTKEANSKKTWDIFFWIGSQSSQDESTSAAINTVQLDNKFNGQAVQHRELEREESTAFKALFRNIQYLPGGVPTGLKHVTDTHELRMFHVKGKTNPRTRQVNPSVASMNQGDCFIVDASADIFSYCGGKASRVEKLKAETVAKQFRDQDYNGRKKYHAIDGYSTPDEVDYFFKQLSGGKPSDVPKETAVIDDQKYDNKLETVVLTKVTDASGAVRVEQINVKPLRQNLLDTNDVFILDTDNADVYVWTGKKSTERERKEAMAKAQVAMQSKKYPAWAKVRRVIEKGEPLAFKQYFPLWRDNGELNGRLF